MTGVGVMQGLRTAWKIAMPEMVLIEINLGSQAFKRRLTDNNGYLSSDHRNPPDECHSFSSETRHGMQSCNYATNRAVDKLAG